MNDNNIGVKTPTVAQELDIFREDYEQKEAEEKKLKEEKENIIKSARLLKDKIFNELAGQKTRFWHTALVSGAGSERIDVIVENVLSHFEVASSNRRYPYDGLLYVIKGKELWKTDEIQICFFIHTTYEFISEGMIQLEKDWDN